MPIDQTTFLDQYELLECPGANGVLIPVVKRTDGFEEDTTGVRVPDWMVLIEQSDGQSTLKGYEKHIELFGWYCESSRHVKGDSSNHLYTSGTLWHSDVFLVMQNGKHNHNINKWIAAGDITTGVTIVRLSRVNDAIQPLQQLRFEICHWAGMHAYLDWSIARFTACRRSNTVFAFDQGGKSKGQTSCTTNYVDNTVVAK
ncbi:MAG: hypothetical protein LBQ43_01055 [Holosporales bacterium]|jgi:hypothetical protein|nr:hypothetical protein [Holosporales bacterium]